MIVDYHGVAAHVDEVGPIYDTYEDPWTGLEREMEVLPKGHARIHMVGDDREIVIVLDEYREVDEDAYCGGCGQMGCGHG